MAASVTIRLWDVADLVELWEASERISFACLPRCRGKGLLLVAPSERSGHIYTRVRKRQLDSGLCIQPAHQYRSPARRSALCPFFILRCGRRP
jgi:hypothetical protein